MNLQQRKLKVILIGDRCFDQYKYGVVSRLSPEAPVPVFVETRMDTKNGMAANVEQNLIALGVKVDSYFGKSSIKTRMIDEKSNQHIVRIDKDIVSESLSFDEIKIGSADAIVVSDYDKGFVTYELVEKLISTRIPVYIDTKKVYLSRFEGAYVKINALEYTRAKCFPSDLIVTRGSGSVLWGEQAYRVPQIDITDVTGAGDTFLSAFTYMHALTKSVPESIQFAIKAASVTVTKRGVYAPSIEEIENVK